MTNECESYRLDTPPLKGLPHALYTFLTKLYLSGSTISFSKQILSGAEGWPRQECTVTDHESGVEFKYSVNREGGTTILHPYNSRYIF